jgi:hypothetical protein
MELSPPTFGLAATGGVPTKVAMQNAETKPTTDRNSLAFIWFPPKHMRPNEFAKILSLNRSTEYSSPDSSAVDNYAAPFRQASKLTAANEADQTVGGTL